MEDRFYVIKDKKPVTVSRTVIEVAFAAMTEAQLDRAWRSTRIEFNPVQRTYKFEDKVV